MLVFKGRPRKSPNLADTITPSQRRIMRLLADARDRVQDSISLTALADDIAHLSAETIANRITVDPWIDMQQALADELLTEVIDAGRRVKLPRIEKAVLTYRFDADRPEARAWADKEAASLIVEISSEQRDVIRQIVTRSQDGEFTVAQVAREVRGSVGLTSRQAQWVENFRQRQIDAAIERGVPAERAPDAVQGAVDRYHKRIHRYRSETIARTETIRASSEGRQEAWRQGLDQGFISPDAEKRWIVEYDGCTICMDNGITGWIGINDTWATGDPPAHPNCRCDVILRDEPVDDLTEMSDEELAAEIESLIAQPRPTPPPLPSAGTERAGDVYDDLPGQDEWLASLTGAQRQALRDYTGKSGDFSAAEINNAIRSGNLTPDQRDRASAIEAAIVEAERLGVRPDSELYRGQPLELTGPTVGVSEEDLRRRLYERTQEIYPIDSEVDLGRGSFVSTSTDVSAALDASLTRNSPGIIFEIAPTSGAPMQPVTRYDDEYEILLSRDKRFRVVGIQQDQTFLDATLTERPRTVVQLQPIE